VGIQRSASSIQRSKHSRGRLCSTIHSEPQDPTGRKIGAERVNGFWVAVCQDVPFSELGSAENPIDCRIYFADNPQRKTESGIGGKNP